MNVVGGVLAILFGLVAAGLSGAALVQGKTTFLIRRPLTEPTASQIREGGIFGLSIGLFAALLGVGWISGGPVGYVLISGGGGLFLLSLIAVPVAAAVRSTSSGPGDGPDDVATPAIDERYIRQTRRYGVLALCAAVGMTVVIETGAMRVSLYIVSAIAGLASLGVINVLWPQLLAPRFQANEAWRRSRQQARRTRSIRPSDDDLSMPPTSPTS